MPPLFKESRMAKKDETEREPVTFIPPSQQSAQGPVPKPGEPIRPEKGVLSGPQPKEMRTKHSSEDVAPQPVEKEPENKSAGVEVTGSKPPAFRSRR
jgi:hypothetical protein